MASSKKQSAAETNRDIEIKCQQATAAVVEAVRRVLAAADAEASAEPSAYSDGHDQAGLPEDSPADARKGRRMGS